jgi:nitroimidazol reductase NimA-like FMN-containing flavoprotein (pyridoxamine 5'-phosphate oxidase superfamily)
MDLLEVISFDECLRALASQRVGRIALTHRALPVVFPVNYVLDGHSILLRTAPGTALAAARDEVVVAFEIDDVDEQTQSGWSVLVTGFMRELTDTDDNVRADQLDLVSWTGGGRDHYVRITPARVTGRRIQAHAATPVGAGRSHHVVA